MNVRERVRLMQPGMRFLTTGLPGDLLAALSGLSASTELSVLRICWSAGRKIAGHSHGRRAHVCARDSASRQVRFRSLARSRGIKKRWCWMSRCETMRIMCDEVGVRHSNNRIGHGDQQSGIAVWFAASTTEARNQGQPVFYLKISCARLSKALPRRPKSPSSISRTGPTTSLIESFLRRNMLMVGVCAWNGVHVGDGAGTGWEAYRDQYIEVVISEFTNSFSDHLY